MHKLVVLLSLGSVFAFPAMGSAKAVSLVEFNKAFVAELNGGPATATFLATTRKSAAFRAAQAGLKTTADFSGIAALGESLCAVDGAFRYCWQPVKKNGALSIEFNGDKNYIFTPTSPDEKQFKKELVRFFVKSKKQFSFSEFLGKSAFAEGADEGHRKSKKTDYDAFDSWPIEAKDVDTIYASYDGWYRTPGITNPATADEALASNKSGDQIGKDIYCQGNLARITAKNMAGSAITVQQQSKNDFLFSTAGKKFKVVVANPEQTKGHCWTDVESYSHYKKSIKYYKDRPDTPDEYEQSRVMSLESTDKKDATILQPGQQDISGGLFWFLGEKVTADKLGVCRYNVPPQAIQIFSCTSDASCDTPVDPKTADWMGLAGYSPAQIQKAKPVVAELDSLEQEYKKLDATINDSYKSDVVSINVDDVIKQQDAVAAKMAAAAKSLEAMAGSGSGRDPDQWNKKSFLWSTNMLAIKAAVAGQQCAAIQESTTRTENGESFDYHPDAGSAK